MENVSLLFQGMHSKTVNLFWLFLKWILCAIACSFQAIPSCPNRSSRDDGVRPLQRFAGRISSLLQSSADHPVGEDPSVNMKPRHRIY
jgi:hypothetical protein